MYYQRPLVYKILESVFRHKRLFFAAIITIVLLLIVFVVTRPKMFNTQMTVVLNSQTISNPIDGESNVIDWDTVNQTVGHFNTLLQTKEFLQEALMNPDGSEIKLDRPIDFNDSAQLAELQKGLAVTAQGEDSFIISLSYPDANDSQTILASLVRVFIENNAQEKASYYTEQVTFITQQVASYRTALQTAEGQLADFQHANAAHMPSQQEAIEQQLVNLNQQLQQYQLQLAEDQDQEKLLAQQVSQTPKTIVASQTVGDSPLDTELKNLEVQRTTDITVYGMKPNHPQIVALNGQIQKLEQQINSQRKSGAPAANGVTSQDVQPNPQYQYLFNQLGQLKISEQGLQAEVADTQTAIGNTQQGVSQVPEEERELANLQRDYSFNSDTYGLLLRRLQEAKINEQLNLRQQRGMYEIYLTQPPTSSTSKAKLAMLFAGGLILALIVGGALVVLSEGMDRSFRDPYDLQRTLGVPVLAMLPESPDLHVADSNTRLLSGGSATRKLSQSAKTALLGAPTSKLAAASAAAAAERPSGSLGAGTKFDETQIAGAGEAA